MRTSVHILRQRLAGSSRLAVGCGIGTMVLAVLALAGQWSGHLLLASLVPSQTPMAVATACFLTFTSAVLVVHVRGGGGWHKFSIALLTVLLLATLIETAGLVATLLGTPWVLVHTFFRVSPSTVVLAVPCIAAVDMLLLHRLQAAACLALAAALAALVFALSYVYHAPLLAGGTVVPMALSTSIAFVLLGLGTVAAAGPTVAPFSWFAGTSTRAVLLRAFLPVFAVATIGMDLLRFLVLSTWAIPTAVLSAASAVVVLLVVMSVASRTARTTAEAIDQAEAALFSESERLHVTLHSIGDGVVATDAGGRVTLLNKAAEDLTGWSQVEALGRSVDEIFELAGLHGEAVACPIGKALASGALEFLAEHTLRGRRGQGERTVAHSAAPIRDRSGTVIGAVLVFRDITQDVQMRKDIERISKLDSLAVMAGGIAHDFNNILMAIAGSIGVAASALQASDADTASTHLQHAESAAIRARQLGDRLLTFSRGKAPQREILDCVSCIRESVALVLSGSKRRGTVEHAPDLWPIHADPGQLSQVLHNLLINACQAADEGSVIRVKAENQQVDDTTAVPVTPGPYVKITVEDEGAGIPAETLSRIFDPFFTTRERGSGLGLASVYSIMRSHEGGVQVDSTPGRGSAFRVFFPAQPDAVLRPRPPDRPPSSARPWHILVMDDEKPISRMLQMSLQLRGHRVETAADGAEALATWSRAAEEGDPFDLVILDLTIPGGMGGKETVARLRALDPAVVTIATSGYSTDPVMARPTDFGFTERLAKPFGMATLHELIQRLQESALSPDDAAQP